jgi:hypothetical protein
MRMDSFPKFVSGFGDGANDFASPGLSWSKEILGSGNHLVAHIPASRLDEFILGEERRCETKFSKHGRTKTKGECLFCPENLQLRR